jgi:antitoxin component HigA of HigAB toxin-antitoxin module
MDVVNMLTSQPNPTEGQLKYLDTLTILIERYEDEIEGVEPQGVNAVAVLRYLLEDRGENASDLGQLLGNPDLGAEILNGDRSMSTSHIKILAKHFNVSPGVLLD